MVNAAYTILEDSTREVSKGTIHLVRIQIKKSEYAIQSYVSNHGRFADLVQVVKNWNFGKCKSFGSIESAVNGTDGVIKEVIREYFQPIEELSL